MNDQWAIGWTYAEHNHPPLADPFSHEDLRRYRPKHELARQLASTHRNTISFADSKEILAKQGLQIDRREFYNLTRKEGKVPLSKQEELELLMGHLERHGFHPRCRTEYIVENRVRVGRVARDIFFMSDEQVRLARRFVSGFMYETDATFNTNTLRLPLSVMVGVDNTGTTFPMSFMFITSESAKSFKFASDQLTDLCFYDCPEARVICGDFSKGLGAAIALKAKADVEEDDGNEFLDPHQTVDLLEGNTIVVDVQVGCEGQRTILQLCEWHAIEAIKRRLIHSGGYSKEARESLTDLLNKWVKANTVDEMIDARKALLSQLRKGERDYLTEFYQPKEHQFCRAYTRTYVNLGVHSTQRNESYHVVVKQRLHKNLSLSAAVEALIGQIKELAEEYNKRINHNRKAIPNLMDRHAFREAGPLLTHYAINLTMAEYRATKDLADAIECGKMELLDFNETIGCEFGCHLPARYRLPCKHWMYYFYIHDEPLPISLFHPRWLLDGPPIVRSWTMSSRSISESGETLPPRPDPPTQPTGRYADDGAQRVLDAAATAIEKLRSLPPGQKEAFAAGFVDLTLQLGSRADEMMASRQALPAELPDPLTQPNVKYKANRRRAYTGREAAEEEEKNRRRAARKANREAELQRTENEAWNTELVQEARDRVKARDVLVVHAPAIVAQQRQQLAPPTLPTPSNVIEISSDEDKTESVDHIENAAETQDIIKVEPIQDIGALVDAGEGECTSSTESEDVGRGRD
jgi:hypothetical protein